MNDIQPNPNPEVPNVTPQAPQPDEFDQLIAEFEAGKKATPKPVQAPVSDAGDDDEVDVTKVVKSATEPLAEDVVAIKRQLELQGFLSSEDGKDFSAYAKKIEKVSMLPQYKNLPASQVAYLVAGKELLKIGAERAKKAEEEARVSSIGNGSPTRPVDINALPDLSKVPVGSHEARMLMEQAKAGQFDKR
jgi:hypothetical protein